MSTLDQEFDTFQQALPALVAKDQGRFVVIKGEKVAGIYDTYSAALDWAYETYGLSRFFVKEISITPPMVHFSRDRRPCVL